MDRGVSYINYGLCKPNRGICYHDREVHYPIHFSINGLINCPFLMSNVFIQSTLMPLI